MAEKDQDKKQEKKKESTRLREITQILAKHKILRGVTPEKLREILEELGPTYIKLGQIMSLHSDILPQKYCDELMKLNSDVTPMPFEDVEEVLNHSYREDWHEIFESIEPVPIGSASIAQVHRARLKNGEDVIIKVERRGIYNTMARDIRLLHKAVKILPSVGGLKDVVDLGQVLDEMWTVAQEEMNFLKEADNMEEFARCNKDVAFVYIPKLYREFTTTQVLVMEYIGGCAINDKKSLEEGGYDLTEIGTKLVDNYIKQVIDDGFFHADPHPGNVKVRDGKIVWIDMGMMGRLTDSDRKLLVEAVEGIADHDIERVENAVLSLGDFSKKPDNDKLYRDLENILQRYGDMDISRIDIAEFFQAVMEAMKLNHIRMPHGLTMLARGLTQMEGVLTEISPGINMVEIARRRITQDYLNSFNLTDELKHGGSRLWYSLKKAVEIPGMLNQILKDYQHGQNKFSLELKASTNFAWLLRKLVQNLVIGMWVLALLIASSILCTTDMKPKIMGIPLLGFLGFSLAFAIVLFLIIRHFITRKKNS